MPVLACQQNISASTWVASGPTNAAYVYSTKPVHLPWSTGAPDIQPRGIPALVLPGSANTVDLTIGPWLVVAVQGYAANCFLVLESSFASLDTILGAVVASPSWLVVARRFRNTSVDWQA